MSTPSQDFRDRSVIVTGGTSGIGLACVQRLLEGGARVGIHGLPDFEDYAVLAARFGDRVWFEAGDVTVEDDVRGAHAAFTERLGPADGLVCAAGALSKKAFRDTSLTLWRASFAVNVEGVFSWIQAVLPSMIERRDGRIVTFSSQLTKAGGRNNAAYIAAKGALSALTRTLALEHAADNVRINAVVPGAIDTPMLRNGLQRFDDPHAASERSRLRHPLGRFGTAEEIAACVAFLLSDAAGFMTGSELVVDGGWSIG